MTEERSCKTCGLSSFNNGTGKACGSVGVSDCIGYAKWQPIAQEKKTMENKVIFESEEECAEFLCNVYNHNKEYSLRSLVPMEKQKGYIRKTAVEIVEEEYLNHKSGNPSPSPEIILDKMYLAIQELKSEIARGKK